MQKFPLGYTQQAQLGYIHYLYLDQYGQQAPVRRVKIMPVRGYSTLSAEEQALLDMLLSPDPSSVLLGLELAPSTINPLEYPSIHIWLCSLGYGNLVAELASSKGGYPTTVTRITFAQQFMGNSYSKDPQFYQKGAKKLLLHASPVHPAGAADVAYFFPFDIKLPRSSDGAGRIVEFDIAFCPTVAACLKIPKFGKSFFEMNHIKGLEFITYRAPAFDLSFEEGLVLPPSLEYIYGQGFDASICSEKSRLALSELAKNNPNTDIVIPK